jgi:hypothetical protein
MLFDIIKAEAMIGTTISQYKILAKLGEACPAKGSRQARGGMSSFSKNTII